MLRVKAVLVLMLLSLFVLSGCGSSGSQGDPKLISAEGEVEGNSTQTSYTYDGHDNLTSLYTKEIMDEARPLKASAPGSSEMASEYKMEYDDNGNITQIQRWTYFFDGEMVTYSGLYDELSYTYTDNRLTGYIRYTFNGPGGMEPNEKMTYEYDDEGEMVTIEVFQRDDIPLKAFAENPSQRVIMEYDENKNLTLVEREYLADDWRTDKTYVMSYNTDNQMETYSDYNGVNLVIDDSIGAVATYELAYDTTANTVTMTRTDTVSPSSTRFGFTGRDIGYRMLDGGSAGDRKIAGPGFGAGLILAPAKLVELLSVSSSNNVFGEPEALLATQLLITERTGITAEPSSEETLFSTIFDGNGYPETMTFHDFIDIYDEVQDEWIYYDLDINLVWE